MRKDLLLLTLFDERGTSFNTIYLEIVLLTSTMRNGRDAMVLSDYSSVQLREWLCPVCGEVVRPDKGEKETLHVLMFLHFYDKPACGGEMRLRESAGKEAMMRAQFDAAVLWDRALQEAGLSGLALVWLRNPRLQGELELGKDAWGECHCVCPLGHVH